MNIFHLDTNLTIKDDTQFATKMFDKDDSKIDMNTTNNGCNQFSYKSTGYYCRVPGIFYYSQTQQMKSK